MGKQTERDSLWTWGQLVWGGGRQEVYPNRESSTNILDPRRYTQTTNNGTNISL